jgi:arginyl-tRNA synthetase
MDIRKYIADITASSINELQKSGRFDGFAMPKIAVSKPKEKLHGDYSISVAMEIGKKENQNPMEIAEAIKEQLALQPDLFEYFDLIEVMTPGFINFYLSKKYLWQVAEEVIEQGDKFGNLDIGKKQKVQVEFISANPTGPLTVGNGRGGPYGDVLANVLTKAGYKTEKAYYVNDYGQQILALGHSVLKDADAKYTGDYIDEMTKTLAPKISDPYKLGKEAAKIVLENIKATIEKLNIRFDEWFSETKLYDNGEVDKAVEFLKRKDFIYELDGAQWFKATQFGDERDRVLVKTDGTNTYLAGDIAYHKHKFEKQKFDKVINVWGADHFGDVAGLMAGVEAIGHKGKLQVVLLQFVTVVKDGKPVKMSKRLGTAIAMDDLLDELPADVIRFFFLQKSANTHLNFDMDLAKEQSDKNPVFYVQYAYARIASILRSASANRRMAIAKQIKGVELLVHPAEFNLIKQIGRLTEVVEDTAEDYQVHRLTQYALDLATAFHQFYNECHVLVDDENLKQARLGLLTATQIALKNTLDILGISAPDKM